MINSPAAGGRIVPLPLWTYPATMAPVLAAVFILAAGCREESPLPPIPAPVVNLGDPKVKTIELSISEPSRGPSVIRETRNSRFNVTWLGPIQPSSPDKPKPFLVKIGRKYSDGVLVEHESVLVLQCFKKEGTQARYRVVMNAPKKQGVYWLQLQTPGKVVQEIQLVID